MCPEQAWLIYVCEVSLSHDFDYEWDIMDYY